MSKRPETFKEGQSMQPAQKKRPDRVELNVGGTSFQTAASTLTMHSSYFEAQFSREWLGDSGDGDDDGPVFLDQDPEAFATLLAFMRVGHVRSESLSAEVLILAEFLGMRQVLDAVKCMAYCNSQPDFAGSFEDAVAKFDEDYGSVTVAVQKGILPSYITERKEDGPKEYAQVLIWDKAEWHLEAEDEIFLRDDLLLNVCVPENASDPPQEGNRRLQRVPDCHVFLDALNWLHRNGFTTREEADEKMSADDTAFDMLLFSRKLRKRHLFERLSSLIVSHDTTKEEERPKQFAAMISSFSSREGMSYVEADVGTSTEVLTSLGPVTVSISRVVGNLTEGYNWLQKEGYLKKEESLGLIYQRIKDSAGKPVYLSDSDGMPVPLDYYSPPNNPPKVAIFSRPLQSRREEEAL